MKHKLELSNSEYMFMFSAIPLLLEQLIKESGAALDYDGVIEICQLALSMRPTFEQITAEVKEKYTKRQQFELQTLLDQIDAPKGKAN